MWSFRERVNVSDSWVETSSTRDLFGTVTDSVVMKGSTGTVTGNAVVPTIINEAGETEPVEIQSGVTLTIPTGTSLTVPATAVLLNNGTIDIQGTFTNNGTSTCGTSSGHALVFHPEVPATETSAGVQAYYSCAICGNVFDANKNPTTNGALGIPELEPEDINTTPPDYILNAGGVEEVSVSDEDSGIVDENGAMTVTIDHKTLSDLVIYRRDGYLIHGWTAEAYIPREVLKELYVNHTSCDIVLEFTPAANPEGTSRPAYQIDLYCLKNGAKTPIELTTGEISVWLPYTIAPGEDSASLTVVTLDADGKVQHLENASYEDGKMTFAIRKSGVYGVGYAE